MSRSAKSIKLLMARNGFSRFAIFRLPLAALCLLTLSLQTKESPQNGQAAAARITSDRICGYKPITGFGASSIGNNEQAKALLNEVIKAAGVRPETFGILAAEVDNAYACENDEGNGTFRRYILYNPRWLNNLIAEVGTDWTARAILAHEVGHHKKGHNLRDLRDSRGCAADLEAEADEVAGEALAKLGASLEEAQAPFRHIAQDKGDQCYPSRAERVAAVRRGWVRVKGDPYPKALRSFISFHETWRWGKVTRSDLDFGWVYLRSSLEILQPLSGGTENGQPLWVCRAHYKNGIHPGRVVTGKCNFSFGGQEVILPDYEILTGTGRWGTPQTNFAGAFAAGEEDGHPLYLCRAEFNGGVHPGKVVNDKCNIGYGGFERVLSTYEVLYYNPPGLDFFWNKVAETTWKRFLKRDVYGREHKYDSTDYSEFEEVGRATVEGDSGTILRAKYEKALQYLEYFVPDKGSKRMWLRSRANGGPWHDEGEFKAIQ